MNSASNVGVPTGRPSALRAAMLLGLALVATVATCRLRPTTPSSTAAPATDIVRGCALMAWALVLYVASAVAISCLAHLATTAGVAGPGLRTLAALAPRRLRRLVDLAVTAGLTAAVLTSAASTVATAATPRHVHAAPLGRPVPAGAPLDWPGLSTTPHAAAAPSTAPSTAPSVHPAAPPARHHRIRHHRADVGLVAGGHPNGSAAGAAPAEIVVQAGDSLWSIAERHLGPDPSPVAVTAAWHDWYEANRAVIGPDPGRIFPGQRLRPPTTTSMPTDHSRSPR